MKTIFIAIPSYRDAELSITVERVIDAADRPERLRFGICQQDKVSDWVDFGQIQQKAATRVLNFLPEESYGLCWALNKCHSLYEGEDYFLQIDAHSELIQGWDEILIKQHETCVEHSGSNSNILSSYPGDYVIDKDLKRTLVPHGYTAKTRLHYEGVIPFPTGNALPMQESARPLKARYLNGGFMFGHGSFSQKVPYNPEIVFWGTEILTTVRAYTSGFNLYHPSLPIGWHHYGERYIRGKGRPHTWNLFDDEKRPIKYEDRNKKSFEQVLQVLSGTYEGRYGLGSERSLQDFERYSGLNFASREQTPESESGDYEDC
jgi:glycosyltransferase involved in cell wall biosynthesis